MKTLIAFILVILLIPIKADAAELTAPTVPDSAEYIFPEEEESFAEGMLSILEDALQMLQPAVLKAAATCISIFGVVMLVSLCVHTPNATGAVIEIVGVIGISYILLRSSGSLIQMGAETVTELSEYGKLLLPVLTAGVAAQGGTGTSAALYSGTVIFDSVLCGFVSNAFLPLLYIFLALSAASCALKEDMLSKVKGTVKWAMTWCLKGVLYVFIGYVGITGVVSGTADAAAVKATKLTISGAVPVVGGILADASETILVSAGVMKNAAGIYGMLAFVAMLVGPFIQIGAQYILLKLTAAVCRIFGVKGCCDIVDDFSAAMGLLLAATGTECLLLMISTVCFMKGVG